MKAEDLEAKSKQRTRHLSACRAPWLEFYLAFFGCTYLNLNKPKSNAEAPKARFFLGHGNSESRECGRF